ncbi:HIT family protein [Pseudalkalibacillus sp. Hm43]|uniref:HIT family protein n=1 Tax=Pseudalkalibacillus sp. Hm43 TaxID=3450742 RepID=UPI003F420D70
MMDWKKDRIQAAKQGENPMVLAKMKSGFAVIGDTQFLPGYCVLLPNRKVDSLNSLTLEERSDYLLDMSLIGDAIQKVCSPLRINYSIYGNTDTYLHAHIFPRYDWETEERRVKPVWLYPSESWTEDQYLYHENLHEKLRTKLTDALEKLVYERGKRL